MDVNLSLFECSLFHSDSLKHKVTVEKDTVNIKQAVCCSEVGQIGESVNRSLTASNHRPSFVPITHHLSF